MTAVTEAGPRIATLDVVRGVAVMGILAMNIVAFAMPAAAYMNPMAYGTESPADLASWMFSFILIDGRMRGLFSFLFGASMLLVIDRAEAAGASPASVHYRRMLWLLVFGLVHFYFIWWGDILSLYAPIGMIAYVFRRSSPRTLIIWAGGLLLAQFALFATFAFDLNAAAAAAAAPGASEEAIKRWASMSEGFAPYEPAQLEELLARYRGGHAGVVRHMLGEELADPIMAVLLFGAETLGYMLLGMAALRTGFLTGAWPDRLYRRVALVGFGIGVPIYIAYAWIVLRSDFAVTAIVNFNLLGTVPVRPLMIAATAALVILLTRPGGALVDRIAAAGRAAFTNYIGTSVLMTALFYGWGAGLYGHLSRIELWIPVIATWALMLLWSKPWLDRFLYGPFEWLWRSLARWEVQPLRRLPAAA